MIIFMLIAFTIGAMIAALVAYDCGYSKGWRHATDETILTLTNLHNQVMEINQGSHCEQERAQEKQSTDT